MLAHKTVLKVDVPLTLSTLDMNERGERSGPMDLYGPPYRKETIAKICKAWEVVDSYCTNPGIADAPPEITNASGPRYMLLFKDSVWRYASFGGLNGPPWFHCEFTGIHQDSEECYTGELAWLYRRAVAKVVLAKSKIDELARINMETAELLREFKVQKEAYMKTQAFEQYQARKRGTP